MQVVLAGNLVSAVVSAIKSSIDYVEEDVLTGIVGEVLPVRGLVVEATKDELKNNDKLQEWMYHDIEIKAKDNSDV